MYKIFAGLFWLFVYLLSWSLAAFFLWFCMSLAEHHWQLAMVGVSEATPMPAWAHFAEAISYALLGLLGGMVFFFVPALLTENSKRDAQSHQ